MGRGKTKVKFSRGFNNKSYHKNIRHIDPTGFDRTAKAKIFTRDKGRCFFCGRVSDEKYFLSYAHLIPAKRGGKGVEQNGVLACMEREENLPFAKRDSCHFKLDFTEERRYMQPQVENYLRDCYPGWNPEDYIIRGLKRKIKVIRYDRG